jgi:hypothetical protein
MARRELRNIRWIGIAAGAGWLVMLESPAFHRPPDLAESQWTEDSFEDFIDGRFLDAGTSRGRVDSRSSIAGI